MLPKRLVIPLALFAAAAMGAAALWPGLGADVVTYVDQDGFYTQGLARQGVGPEGMAAEIFGAPQAQASPDEIAARLELPPAFPNKKVRAIGPEERAENPVRIVLLFNAGVPSRDIACREPEEIGARAQGGALFVFAFLCFNDGQISQAALKNSAVDGLDDPHFADSMAALLRALLPSSGSDSNGREGLFGR
ncbi:MAG: hypothetical protein H6923_05125 [Alphaproteobacteria bacterium]|nr:hypothetical protein [Alphaproteobacteria bacterium]